MKRIQGISLFLLLAASATGQATQTFDTPVLYPISGESHAMTTGDVTGDQLDDVIVATDAWDKGLGLWLFKGASGGLVSAVQLPYPSAAYTKSLWTADFNGSGTNQILLLNTSGRMYLISYGHRTRTVLIPYATADYANIGDFNGDGSPDIVIADIYAGGHVLLNDGHGGFSQQLAFPLPSFAEATTAVGDLDGDGDPDYVFTVGSAYVYLNQGGGVFGAPTVIEPSMNTGSASVGDFNDDGLDDLVLAESANDPVIKTYRQNAGTLAYVGAMPTAPIPNANAVADADGDGDDDLAYVHAGWGVVGIHHSSSDGLSAEDLYELPWVSFESDIRISDVTDDACRDLVVSNGYQIAVFAGHGCAPVFDLRLASAPGPESVSLIAENPGTAIAAENVSVLATLTTRTGLLDVSSLPAGCVPTRVAAKSTTVRCEVASIPASQASTWLIPYSVVPADTSHRVGLSAIARTDTPEQDLLNNRVSRYWYTTPTGAKAKAKTKALKPGRPRR
jgi:hypothetical protein